MKLWGQEADEELEEIEFPFEEEDNPLEVVAPTKEVPTERWSQPKRKIFLLKM